MKKFLALVSVVLALATPALFGASTAAPVTTDTTTTPAATVAKAGKKKHKHHHKKGAKKAPKPAKVQADQPKN
jgi:hypothetical protein